MLCLMELILISGFSGSGKSVALNLLEDSGYYCVDNLPVAMLTILVRMLREEKVSKLAVAIDARSGGGIELLSEKLEKLSEDNVRHTFLFLYSNEETLLKRYSETRRRHPLASDQQTLAEAIHTESELLAPISNLGHRIDTSGLKANALREWVRQFVEADASQGLTLMFQSFGFKHGIPLDADLVFDVRCLPNPYYTPELRPLTGRDQPVIDFLEGEPDVLRMRADIARFVSDWLPNYIRDNRNYLTVAIGCTGGQHRSVYLAEVLAGEFSRQTTAPVRTPLRTLVRHRTLAGA
jgi:RNase adapter protein RapZ